MLYSAAQPTTHRRDRYVGLVLEFRDGMSRALAETHEDYNSHKAALAAAEDLRRSMLTARRRKGK